MKSHNLSSFGIKIVAVVLATVIILLLTGCSGKSPEQSRSSSQQQTGVTSQSSSITDDVTESRTQTGNSNSETGVAKPQTAGDTVDAADSQKLYATTDDNIHIGERLKSGKAERITVDHPLLGGTWVNEETGVLLEFSEEGYVNFDRLSAGGGNDRYVYELFVDAIEVGVNSGGILSEFWYYTIDGNSLNIRWNHGSGAFIRDGGNPGDTGPAALAGLLVEGWDETSWVSEDSAISLRFFQTGYMVGKLNYNRRYAKMDLGD